MPIHQLVGLFFEDTDVLMSVCVWPTNCDDLSSCLISNMSISHQSVSCFLYWNLTRRPDPPVTNFPGSIGLKILGFKRSFFFSMIFGPKKHAGYSPSVQKHLPKIFSTQSNPRKDPEWALRPSFPKLGRWSPPRGLLFWVEFDLGMDGNPWKPIIFPDFFGTTIHLPTIWPGYQDFDTAISRHASYLALVMDSLISPAGRRGRGKMVLFSSPFSHPQGLPSGKLT